VSRSVAERPDLRLVPAAAATWAGVLLGLAVPLLFLVVAAAGATMAALAVGRLVRSRPARIAALVALACLATGLLLGAGRAATLRAGPVDDLAAQGAAVRVTGVLTTDPQMRTTAADRPPYVIARLRVESVTGRGITTAVRTPVLVLGASTDWTSLLPGQQVSAAGRLAPADRFGSVAAILRVRDPPRVHGPPGLASSLTEPLRSGLREAVDELADAPRGLVPALVIGDESRLPASLRADMVATGLTHLTAVSGTNVTILLVAVLGLARWAGVRGYGLPVLGGLTVIGFVALARPEPSVLRAAAMGLVAVAGLTVAGRRRGLPVLATAALVLLLVDPWLARDAGFALSVLATGAILVLAPAWRDAMPWIPRPVAELLAVALAAQVACTPLVVAIMAQASLASVPANILVAPVVAPTTVLGAAAAVCSPVSATLADALGRLAGLPARWIVAVAGYGADLPGAVVAWPGGALGVGAATAVALAAVAALPVLLRRPLWSAAAGVLVAVAVLTRPPTLGWPPPGWVVVACDVGQGDAIVLHAGPRSAVVIDTGPDPPPVDRCLDSLGIEQVPLLVLTHFHADHVAGLSGVLDGRRVGQGLVSPLDDPEEYADLTRDRLAEAAVPVAVGRVGDDITVGGSVHLRVIWPRRVISDGSPANNTSLVIDASVSGVRVLLGGDVEPEAQRAILGSLPRLRADVLKVPHHGSGRQEPDLLTGLGARLALVSVGAGNTYGHPATDTIELLQQSGMRVLRSDRDGSVAVVRMDGGGLGVVTGGPRVTPRRRMGVRGACDPWLRCPLPLRRRRR
jgi:competence protein ComEC